jgi:HK97 family phage major capsid protein
METYTLKDITNVRSAKDDAVAQLAEAEQAHVDLVAKVRKEHGDTAIFAAEHETAIRKVAEARMRAADEVSRLKAREAEIAGYLVGRGEQHDPQVRAEMQKSEDFAARMMKTELMQVAARNFQAAKALTADNVLTRSELVDLLKTRAFDATAGAGLRTPDYTGIRVDVLTRKPRLIDFVSVTPTNTDVVDWVSEGAQTNTVGYADFGSTTTESAYSFSHVSTTISRLTSWITVTDGQLADAPQVESEIRDRMLGAVNRFLENEIYKGDGTGSAGAKHLEGFSLAATANATPGLGVLPFDAVMEAIVAVQTRTLLNIDPTVLAINPLDYKKLALAKDGQDRYIISNPTANVITPIWGLTPVVTPLVDAGTPWVGDLSQFRLWVRDGLSVSMSDNVDSNFLKGLKVLKTELRVGGKTLRPEAFQKITNFGS